MDVRMIGPYRLESLIGVGGMGEVYRAYDTRRDRVVALKLLPESLSSDPEYMRRFRRESHVAARLREPHVIPIHDYGEIDGRLYIDMRLVDGKSIRELIAEGGAMAPARAVHIISQVAEALEAAHADGLVHRDIKPSNVLVTRSGFVYVVDFGIARSMGTARTSLTITGVTVGTLDYMAPERFTNQQIDGRADVYSLACLLHECLTGDQPYPGEDLPSLMYAHLYMEPPRPSRFGAPAAFDEVVAKGMAKTVAERFANPAELAEAAQRALEAEPAASRGTPTPARSGEEPPGAGRQPEFAGGDETMEAPIGTPGRHHRTAPPKTPPPQTPPLGEQSRGSNSRGWRAAAAVIGATVITVVLVVIGIVMLLPGPAGPINGVPSQAAGPPVGAAAPPGAVQDPDPGPQIAPSIAVPTVRGTIPAGTTPGYMDVAPSGRFAYIANRDAGFVSVLDTTINTVTATIPIPAGPPQFVTFSPVGDRAYVSIFNAERTVNLIGVLDTSTNTLLGTIPVGRRPYASATNTDGSVLYVPSHDDGRLDLIDTASSNLITSVQVAPNPHWVAFSRSENRVYMANHESNVVSVLDPTTNTVLTTIPVGTSPHSTAVSPDGTRVSVVNFDSSTVSVIDSATHQVVATVPVGRRPQDIAYAPDGRYMYTANVDGDSLSVIDTATNAVTATIPADSPTSVGVLPNGRSAYVTNLNSGTVTILDLTAS